tara:strand:- start:114 stop:347 length:234 start_codon:yes stop_codon:yes gene_type:complete
MINEIISMNGYGTYVWSAFSFTLISFAVLYAVIKMQLVKEQIKFNAKFVTLTSDKIQSAKAQETYREILVNTSISKI